MFRDLIEIAMQEIEDSWKIYLSLAIIFFALMILAIKALT